MGRAKDQGVSNKIARRYAGNGLGTEITPRIHQRGYELWRVGLQEKRCRQELGMTVSQWLWLKTVGGHGMPSYEEMLIEDVRQIQTSAREAATAIGVKGAGTIGESLNNASDANYIIAGILGRTKEQLSVLGNEPNIDDCLPSKIEREMLKICAKLSDLRPIAEAFRTIYGDTPQAKVLFPTGTANAHGEIADPLVALQGKEAERENFISEDAMSDVVDGLGEMTPEELASFANGGHEVVTD